MLTLLAIASLASAQGVVCDVTPSRMLPHDGTPYSFELRTDEARPVVSFRRDGVAQTVGVIAYDAARIEFDVSQPATTGRPRMASLVMSWTGTGSLTEGLIGGRHWDVTCTARRTAWGV